MRRQFRRLDFDQVRFDVLDNSGPRFGRQQINDRRVDRSGRERQDGAEKNREREAARPGRVRHQGLRWGSIVAVMEARKGYDGV